MKHLYNQQPTTNNQQPTTNNQQPTSNKLKQFSKIGLLVLFFSLSFLFFYSCQKDELIEAPPDGVSSGLVYKKITQSEVENNTALLKAIKSYNRAIQEIPLQKSTKSFRLKDYKIAYHKGVLITNKSTRSYTFKLVPRNDNSIPAPYLLNIVLVTPKAKSNFWHRVIAYDLTPQQHFKLKNGKQLTGKLAYTYINTQNPEAPISFNHPHTLTPRPPRAANGGDGDGNGMGGTLPTVTITAPPPDDNWPPEDDTTPPVEPTNPSFTEDDDNGGGGGGSTTPVDDPEDPEEQNDPCGSTHDQFSDANFKKKIDSLASKTSSSNEWGYTENSDTGFSKIEEGEEDYIKIDINATSIGWGHTHPIPNDPLKSAAMFSIQDFIMFKTLLNSVSRNPNVQVSDAYGLMVNGSGSSRVIYMLKFSGDFSQIYNNFNNKPPSGDALKKLYDVYYNEYKNMEAAFIHLVNDSIFKTGTFSSNNFHLMRIEVNNDGSLKKSSEISLNDKGKKQEVDCNN